MQRPDRCASYLSDQPHGAQHPAEPEFPRAETVPVPLGESRRASPDAPAGSAAAVSPGPPLVTPPALPVRSGLSESANSPATPLPPPGVSPLAAPLSVLRRPAPVTTTLLVEEPQGTTPTKRVAWGPAAGGLRRRSSDGSGGSDACLRGRSPEGNSSASRSPARPPRLGPAAAQAARDGLCIEIAVTGSADDGELPAAERSTTSLSLLHAGDLSDSLALRQQMSPASGFADRQQSAARRASCNHRRPNRGRRVHPLLCKQVLGSPGAHTPGGSGSVRLPAPQPGLHWGVLMPLDPSLPLQCLRGHRVELRRVNGYLYAVCFSRDGVRLDDGPGGYSPRRGLQGETDECQAEVMCYNSAMAEFTVQSTHAVLGVFVKGQRLQHKQAIASGDQIDFFIDEGSDAVDTYVFHWVGAVSDAGVRPRSREAPAAKAKYNWRIGRLLGSGQQGAVHVALDKDTGAQMAVKMIPMTGDNSKQLDAVEREVHICQKLSHEKIVRYLGCERRGEHFCILMELVTGGSARQLLDTFGPFSENVVRIYVLQLLIGLEYLHNNDVVHGDIKSANLLITSAGNLKIADFGASWAPAAAGGASTGTVAWMAPEVVQAVGKPVPTSGPLFEERKKGDIWSVGCTVLEMLTAQVPWHECSFERRGLFAAMMHIGRAKHTPQLPYQASEGATDLLRQCLQLPPCDRPASADLLGHPFLTAPPDPSASRRGSVADAEHPLTKQISFATPGGRSPVRVGGHRSANRASSRSPSPSQRSRSGSVVHSYRLSPPAESSMILSSYAPHPSPAAGGQPESFFTFTPYQQRQPSEIPEGVSESSDPPRFCSAALAAEDMADSDDDVRQQRFLQRNTGSCRSSLCGGRQPVHVSFARMQTVSELTTHCEFAGRQDGDRTERMPSLLRLADEAEDLVDTRGAAAGEIVTEPWQTMQSAGRVTTEDSDSGGMAPRQLSMQSALVSPMTGAAAVPRRVESESDAHSVDHGDTGEAVFNEAELERMPAGQLRVAVRRFVEQVTRYRSACASLLDARATADLRRVYFSHWLAVCSPGPLSWRPSRSS